VTKDSMQKMVRDETEVKVSGEVSVINFFECRNSSFATEEEEEVKLLLSLQTLNFE
jgi:hypothetical protein